MAYRPQPGTIQYRAIAYLRAVKQLKSGPDPSTPELCDALEVDVAGFTAYMRPARQHGLVHTSKRRLTGKLLFWRVGDGTLDPMLGDVVPEPDEPLQRRCEAREAAVDLSQVRNEVLPGVPADARLPSFRALLWEGQLLATGMQIIDGVAVFTPEQVDEIKRQTTWAVPA